MNSDDKKYEITMVLEVLGTPKEKLAPALEEMIKQLGEEKTVKVIEKDIKEPKEIEQGKDIYTNFAEVVVEVEGIMSVFAIMFKYMPSHMEVTHPEKIDLTNNDFNEALNELGRRLHAYDEVARILQIEKAKMDKKIKDLEGKKD